jgi:predicted ribosome quality control (RQC) complex YloA/Tae2 family protein
LSPRSSTMGKERMTLVDVMAVVKEIRTQALGMRLANIYSLSNKLFCFKFAAPSVKKYLLMESGIRLHLTAYAREKDAMPNSFATKLRKHIRTKRLEKVRVYYANARCMKR